MDQNSVSLVSKPSPFKSMSIQLKQRRSIAIPSDIYSNYLPLSTPKIDSSSKGKIMHSSTDRKKYDKFDEFINNCTILQKDISEFSINIEQSLSGRKNKSIFEEKKQNIIRNNMYFKGAKEIEEKIKIKKLEEYPENLRKIKHVLSTPTMKGSGVPICIEDVTSVRAVEYLASNKRNFGKLLDQVKEIQPKEKYKSKDSDIKINPEQTIIEYFNDPTIDSLINKRHNSIEVMPKNFRHENSASAVKAFMNPSKSGKNKKLPPLTLATVTAARAKAAANKFFTVKKVIEHAAKRKKKHKPINLL